MMNIERKKVIQIVLFLVILAIIAGGFYSILYIPTS